MTSLVDAVLEAAEYGHWAQADRDLAKRVCVDYAALYNRLLLGEDVAVELDKTRASLMCLGSAAASTGAAAIEAAIWRVVGRAVEVLMRG